MESARVHAVVVERSAATVISKTHVDPSRSELSASSYSLLSLGQGTTGSSIELNDGSSVVHRRREGLMASAKRNLASTRTCCSCTLGRWADG